MYLCYVIVNKKLCYMSQKSLLCVNLFASAVQQTWCHQICSPDKEHFICVADGTRGPQLSKQLEKEEQVLHDSCTKFAGSQNSPNKQSNKQTQPCVVTVIMKRPYTNTDAPAFVLIQTHILNTNRKHKYLCNGLVNSQVYSICHIELDALQARRKQGALTLCNQSSHYCHTCHCSTAVISRRTLCSHQAKPRLITAIHYHTTNSLQEDAAQPLRCAHSLTVR